MKNRASIQSDKVLRSFRFSLLALIICASVFDIGLTSTAGAAITEMDKDQKIKECMRGLVEYWGIGYTHETIIKSSIFCTKQFSSKEAGMVVGRLNKKSESKRGGAKTNGNKLFPLEWAALNCGGLTSAQCNVRYNERDLPKEADSSGRIIQASNVNTAAQ